MNNSKIKYLLIFIFISTIFSGCKFIEPEIKGFSSFNVKKIDADKIVFTIGIKILNPNNKKITINNIACDIKANDKIIGTTSLIKNVVLKKKNEDTYLFDIELLLDKSVKSKIQVLMATYLLKRPEIKVNGSLKGSINGVKKSIPIEYKY